MIDTILVIVTILFLQAFLCIADIQAAEYLVDTLRKLFAFNSSNYLFV